MEPRAGTVVAMSSSTDPLADAHPVSGPGSAAPCSHGGPPAVLRRARARLAALRLRPRSLATGAALGLPVTVLAVATGMPAWAVVLASIVPVAWALALGAA